MENEHYDDEVAAGYEFPGILCSPERLSEINGITNTLFLRITRQKNHPEEAYTPLNPEEARYVTTILQVMVNGWYPKGSR